MSRLALPLDDEPEDDYLSDKLLAEIQQQSSSTKPSTYADRRKQSQKLAEIKNAQNRKKSRRQLEEESREEGLKKSLFERAKLEEEERGTQNKAMSMMLKMGFKPGQSLGRLDDTMESILRAGPSTATALPSESSKAPNNVVDKPTVGRTNASHRIEPLSVDVWSGRKGIGLGKRPLSPAAVDRVVKTAKIVEEGNQEIYRDRVRRAYEEKRAEGRLISTSRTLAALDEKAGVSFNILSLNPYNAETFPRVLLDALQDAMVEVERGASEISERERLQRQMRRDALQPISLDSEPEPEDDLQNLHDQDSEMFSEEVIQKAREFLSLDAIGRLKRVLDHLRQHYAYCFWCGTQYSDQQDMASNCPGEDEDAHD